jgi:hypothetical protein
VRASGTLDPLNARPSPGAGQVAFLGEAAAVNGAQRVTGGSIHGWLVGSPSPAKRIQEPR